MRIVLYSTNSNYFDGTKFYYKNFPLNKTELDSLCQKFPEHTFIVATQLPGMFLLDLEENEIKEKSSKVEYVILQSDKACDIAKEITLLKPDAAAAATFWTTPYDWLPIKDSMVGEELTKLGVKTYCHSVEATVNCFDKWRTHQAVEKLCSLKMPQAVYVHHALFINGGNRRELKSNVYRESVLMQIKALHFPVVIKDTVGLSSYGMDVVNSFEDAVVYLNSKRNTSDRIIEEYIEGIQFGVEAYGDFREQNNLPSNRTRAFISLPFMFSVNKYGITSPKQSVKLGPVNSEKFSTDELKKELIALCRQMKFCGAAQFDLVFSEKENCWYLIEINPRLSGMSKTVACCYGKSVLELLLENTVFADFTSEIPADNLNFIFDFKLPLLTAEQFEKVKQFVPLKYICQTENLAARQLREQGFCEIIFGGTNSLQELTGCLQNLKREYPEIIEEIFFENANSMLKIIKR